MVLFEKFSHRVREVRRVIYALVVVCWALAVLLFALLPADAPARSAVALGTYSTAAAFSLLAAMGATLNTGKGIRTFWAALWGGLLLRFARDLAWSGFWFFRAGESATLVFHDVAYIASYVLILAALLKLLAAVVNITFLSALEVSSRVVDQTP